ncbi:MAG: hypothetical protein J5892_05190 [Bacilli bacterium]|nr:hypothetical protein [Bacilli bacterium]
MVIGGFMKDLKKSVISISKDDKEIVDSYQSYFLDGYIGLVFNKYTDSDKYEVYIYIKTSNEIASPLLYKTSNDINVMKEYYTELLNYIQKEEPDIIMNRCISKD